ncbi:MAG: hypothetical protein ACRDOO_14480 [Actinomadura sp.]
MGAAEEAQAALRMIARLAEEYSVALNRAFRMVGEDAIIGHVGTRLFNGMSERHGQVRRAFLAAFDQVERQAARANAKVQVPRPSISAPPLQAPSSDGERVGGNPELMGALASALGTAGRAWEEAGEGLARTLSRLGLDPSPGWTIAKAGTWVADQRRQVVKSRDELLNAARVGLDAGVPTTMTTAGAAVPQPEQQEGDPGGLFGWLSDKTGELFSWADEQWMGTVEKGADFVGLDGEQAAKYYDIFRKSSVEFPISPEKVDEGIGWLYDKLGDGAEGAADAVGLDWAGDLARGYIDHVAEPVVKGFAEGTIELAEFAAQINPQRIMIDPVGYFEYTTSMGLGLVYGVEHPIEFAKAAIDWETLKTDPVRWLGHLGPGLILGAATGGSGTAATAVNRIRRSLTAARHVVSFRQAVKDLTKAVEEYGKNPAHGETPDEPAVLRPDGGWEWKGLKLSPENNHLADQVLARAARLNEQLGPDLESMAGRLGGRLEGYPKYAVKGSDRFKEKLAKDISDQPNSPPATLANKIHDGARYTFSFDDASYTAKFAKATGELRRKGYELILQKPSWRGLGYKGVNTRWRDPKTGQIFEVQFHTPASWQAKQVTHKAYEIIENPQTNPEDVARFRKLQDDVFGQVSIPPGAEDIPTIGR